MTKRFCDVCGNPADEIRALEVISPFGPVKQCDDGCNRQKQIRVLAKFEFRDPSGSSGIPDLCGECMLNLVSDLKKFAERNAVIESARHKLETT